MSRFTKRIGYLATIYAFPSYLEMELVSSSSETGVANAVFEGIRAQSSSTERCIVPMFVMGETQLPAVCIPTCDEETIRRG